MVESNTKAVLELLKRPGNDSCADCRSPNPEYASYNIGVFLCCRCAEVHRGMGVHISKVKHLRMDRWEDSQLQRMREIGNRAAKKKYEKNVPPCYRIPREDDPVTLLEQWICAKYAREEFSRSEKPMFMSGYLEEFLMKRGKEDPKYYPRKFTLSEEEDVIKYYVHETKEPKGIIKISDLRVSFAPEKIEKRNSMQLSFPREAGTTRHIFVYHDDPQTIVNWYNAIRCVQLHRLLRAFPSVSQEELVNLLSKDYKEGWLWKTGPRPTDAFKKRWFTLIDRKLLYHDEPLAAMPKGEVHLGVWTDGYALKSGVPKGAKDHGHSFTLCTPDRDYFLSAEKESDKELWIETIQNILSTPLSPYQAAVSRRAVKKKSYTTTSGLNIFSSR